MGPTYTSRQWQCSQWEKERYFAINILGRHSLGLKSDSGSPVGRDGDRDATKHPQNATENTNVTNVAVVYSTKWVSERPICTLDIYYNAFLDIYREISVQYIYMLQLCFISTLQRVQQTTSHPSLVCPETQIHVLHATIEGESPPGFMYLSKKRWIIVQILWF